MSKCTVCGNTGFYLISAARRDAEPSELLDGKYCTKCGARCHPSEVVRLVEITRALLGILTPKQRERQFPNVTRMAEEALKPFEGIGDEEL